MDSIFRNSMKTTKSEEPLMEQYSLFKFNLSTCQERAFPDIQNDSFIQNLELQTQKYHDSLNLILEKKTTKNIPVSQNFEEAMFAMNQKNSTLSQSTKLDNLQQQQDLQIKSLQQNLKSLSKKSKKQHVEPLVFLLSSFWENQFLIQNSIQQVNEELLYGFKIFIQKKFQIKYQNLQNHNMLKTLELKNGQKKRKRHEEQYKFVSKRFLKYLKNKKQLNVQYLIENFRVYFQKKFPDLQFIDYFKCNENKSQFVLRKSNRFFFQIVFDHPLFSDHFAKFQQEFICNYKFEIRKKFQKILLNLFKNIDFTNKNSHKKLFDQLSRSRSFKMPWTYLEIQQAFKFIEKNFKQFQFQIYNKIKKRKKSTFYLIKNKLEINKIKRYK